MADYLQGHPEHPKPIKDGVLRHDGDGGLVFTKAAGSALPLPGHAVTVDVEIRLADAELQAVNLGGLRQSSSIALGGLAPVGDDLLLGLGGVVGGGENGTITCLIERDGHRHLVSFWAEAQAARGLLEEFARARVAMGRRPLPTIESLDAGTEALDRASRRDEQMTDIREQLRRQTELLERIAAALESGR
ncbi:MAG: hypothetical protein AB7I08_08735 [Thermoleophilia bacterium]